MRSSRAAKTTGTVKNKLKKKKTLKKCLCAFSDDAILIHAVEKEGKLKIFITFLPFINM